MLYRGKDIARLTRRERRQFRREVQAIFQDPYEVYNPFYRDRPRAAARRSGDFGLASSAGRGAQS